METSDEASHEASGLEFVETAGRIVRVYIDGLVLVDLMWAVKGEGE